MSNTASNPRAAIELFRAHYQNREVWQAPAPDPREGHYQDLNSVPWYASMIFEERLS